MRRALLLTITLCSCVASDGTRAHAAEPVGLPLVCEAKVDHALTGHIAQPISVRVPCWRQDEQTYSFKDARGWHEGRRRWESGYPLIPLAADLNFDGTADFWVTRISDGQARTRFSEVWLFDGARGGYVFNETLSRTDRLDVEPGRKLLRSGISNCGCAASCFRYDLLRWERGKLRTIARHEADCKNYREYVDRGAGLVPAGPPQPIRFDYFKDFKPLPLPDMDPDLEFHTVEATAETPPANRVYLLGGSGGNGLLPDAILLPESRVDSLPLFDPATAAPPMSAADAGSRALTETVARTGDASFVIGDVTLERFGRSEGRSGPARDWAYFVMLHGSQSNAYVPVLLDGTVVLSENEKATATRK